MGMVSSLYSSMSSSPNFGPLLKLIVTMISDKEMLKKYPLNDLQMKMIRSPTILKMLTDPEYAQDGIDFSEILNSMCDGDIVLTEQMGESYLKALQKSYSSISPALRKIRKFLQIDDKLK